jgi:gallidermin/nisin family lantibiotic
MSTALLDTVTTDDLDLFDLDLEVSLVKMDVHPAITSISLCTPGCTSPGGGSNCSFCC